MCSLKKAKKESNFQIKGMDEWFNALFLDKDFTEISWFLTDFLVNKFHTLKNSFIDSIKSNELHDLVSEYNLINNRFLAISDKSIESFLNYYSNNKYIFSIEVKKPEEFFKVSNINKSYFPLICFMCFDLVNPNKNVFYGVYNGYADDPNKLFHLRFLTNEVKDTSISYKKNYAAYYYPQLTIKEIEKFFEVEDLIYSIDKFHDVEFTTIYGLYKNLNRITHNFDMSISADEIITFTLILNDIKYCSTDEKTKDFDKRASVFNDYATKLRVSSSKELEEIRNQYFLLLQNPNNFIVGQSFRLMPKNDSSIINKLLGNPFGLALLFYIDRIFLKISKADDLMSLIIFDFMLFFPKMSSLIDLRSDILQEITNFINSENIIKFRL
jgi:hypothetical protein